MATPQDHISMALFCDFENVALGVRDAQYDKFDIKPVLERLLLKGSIVVKKAYCDWERYKGFKATMHEANFELIEIPHVRQSGKNSADIRLVVDALDLCYTKSHVNTFVIISGDSDFSPLVSKLRENAKYVIGVGVKQSTSDLLIANCDEFIFYDDLVRESQRQAAHRDKRDNREPQQARRTPEEENRRREELHAHRTKAVEMAAETYEALVTDRDEGGRIWASVLKEAIKRRNPGFNENYYGFRTFGNLLEEARARGLLEFGRDEKSSAYVYRSSGAVPRTEDTSATENSATEQPSAHTQHGEAEAPQNEPTNREDRGDGRRRGRGGRSASGRGQQQGERSERGEARRMPNEAEQSRGRDGGREAHPGDRAPNHQDRPAPMTAPAPVAPVMAAPAPLKASPARPSQAQAETAAPPAAKKAPRAAAKKAPARKSAAGKANASAAAAPADLAKAPTQATSDAPAARKAAPRARRPRKAADGAA
ncbi:NYN domain-containing protein [Aquabacterium sp.]|uniref:NYN domain-containing protein n=1 Tax=Aquabacterium sp. TaxID=1872578 RepID=UPI0019A80E59|nr:NYN domain-containing protein [Aquabacterium sp.]MBC7702085.1 NYN domain-containing protein [Aquabacterium sp.]